jgi:hypothetical protein
LQTIIHKKNFGPLPKPLCYQNLLSDFLQGLTSMKTNPINQQESNQLVHQPMVGWKKVHGKQLEVVVGKYKCITTIVKLHPYEGNLNAVYFFA